MHLMVFGSCLTFSSDNFLTMSIFSNKWKFPWRKLLKIGRNVVGELIYNLVERNYVFIEWFMCYVHFFSDIFFGMCIPSVEALLDF